MQSFRTVGWLVAVVIGLSLFDGAVAQQPSVDTLRVSVAIHTRYDDSERSLQEIQQFIEFLPPESDELNPGETINQFIVRRYRFGPSELPRTYALMERHILRANDIQSSTVPSERHQILAPPLPRRAVPRPNRTNPYNRLPKIITFGTASMIGTAVEQERPTEDDFREGSRTAIVNVQLPRAFVEARKDLPLFNAPTFRVSSAPFQPQMEPSACEHVQVGTTFPDAPLVGRIRATTSRPVKRPTYLYVLDSGWPDEPSYRRAVAHVEGTLAPLRAKYHLAPYVRRQAAAFHAIDPARTSTHALDVNRALADLRDLDPADHVRVIFMPLGLDQGDEDVFRNLLETYYAFSWSTSLDATTPAGIQLSEPVLQEEATNSAEDTITRMKTFAPVGEFHTDKALLEAVYMLADAAAERDKTSYVLNLSWTVGGGLLKFAPPLKPRGLTVVAVGNDDLDFVANEVDFARQSVGDDRYLAVMNIARDGSVLCKSSKLEAARASIVRVVGFNGNLDAVPPEKAKSGTSFAAPRVAWMIALKESLSPEPSLAFWASDLISAVKSIRQLNEPAWKNIWFEPERFFQP